MRTQFSKLAFSAGILFALAFTFGCSSDDGGSGGSGGSGSSSSSKGDGNSSSSIVLKECDAIFNPDNKFCYDGTVYDKCGGKSYNPTTQVCFNYGIEDLCGGSRYNQTKQFCYDGTVYDKCNYNSYNPLMQGCANGGLVVETKCGSTWYNQEVYACCGSSLYDQITQFCTDNIIYDKCDGMEYSPATHICQNGVAVPAKCGNESYNPLTLYCSNGTVKDYDSIIDARDDKKYKVTTIGIQTWMAENLNYAADSSECYDNEPANCATFGRLYNWETAKVACPSGWHLPNDDEWNELITAAGGAGSTGGTAETNLRATISNGTNEFGFSALLRSDFLSQWWSSSEGKSGYAHLMFIALYENYGLLSDTPKDLLKSVRCLQD